MSVLVIEAICILILGLVPSLLSWIVVHKAKQRLQTRLRQARTVALYRQQRINHLFSTEQALEGSFGLVGDQSCRFNAHSPYLRCAVNPSGPCQDCSHYQSR